MSAKVTYVLITIENLEAELNFYRRVLGIREVRTWTDAHLEKAAMFDTGSVKIVLAQEKRGNPSPHQPAGARGRVWLGLQTSADLNSVHQMAAVGRRPDQISPVHDSPWGKGRCFLVLDPEGNPLAVGEQSLHEAPARPRVLG